MPAPSLRVAVDATPLLGVSSGIAMFVGRLLERLATHDKVSCTAYALSRHDRNLSKVVPSGMKVRSRGVPAAPLLRVWKHSSRPDARFWTGPVDVVHATNYVAPPARSAATVVSVHDLFALRSPGRVSPTARRYPDLVARAVRRGAFVHALSETVAAEIVDWLPMARERVAVVPLSAGFLAPGDRSGTDLAGGHFYVLFLGTVEPRKGLPLLIEAWREVEAKLEGCRLVIAGNPGNASQELAQAVADAGVSSVVRLGRVNDADRVALLRDAAVFCLPSIDEGFGIPLLEAMASGTAVIATRSGALPEVAGDAARLVAPDADALADQLIDLLSDDAGRVELAAGGPARAAQFSWDKTAAGMVALYERAARG